MPGVGQPLDVGEKGVPHTGHGALAGPGQAHAGGVVGKPGNDGEHQGHRRADDNVLAQHLPAADGFYPLHQKGGQVKGRVVDDGVHRHPDDLGGHVVGHHGDYHHEEGQKEFPAETLGKGEKPQDAGFFLCVLVHNTPQVGKKDGGPCQEAWHLPGQAGPCGGAGAAKKGRQALGKACRPFHGSKTLLEKPSKASRRGPRRCACLAGRLWGQPGGGQAFTAACPKV